MAMDGSSLVAQVRSPYLFTNYFKNLATYVHHPSPLPA